MGLLIPAEVFFGFGVFYVFAQLWVVFTQAQLIGRVLNVLSRVVGALAGFLGDHAENSALAFALCHNP